MSTQDGMGLREFGRMVGVSGEAIRKAIKTGRIPAALVGGKALKSGRMVPTIADPDAAAAAFGANTMPNYRQDGAKISAGKRAAAGNDVRALAAQQRRQDAAPPPAGGSRAPSITDSRAIIEAYKARLIKLEFDEKAGKLVSADEVKIRYATLATRVRTRLLGVPSKAKGRAPHLSIDDIQMLTELIREALEELADGR